MASFDSRPIVDLQLENDVDRAGMVHQRKPHLTLQQDHFGKGPKGYKRNDQRIFEEVSEELYLSRTVDASDIEVEVVEGRVFLRGKVNARETKRLAERAIENVSGVIDVQNELKF